MGLFNFIQSAGRRLGIGGGGTQDESKPAPPPPAAEAIEGELKSLGLHAPGMEIAVEGNTVKVSGTAPDAEAREKIILAAAPGAHLSSPKMPPAHAAALLAIRDFA